MPNKIKERFLVNVLFPAEPTFEYFIRYDGGGKGQDSVQGIVICSNSAKDAIDKVESELSTLADLLDVLFGRQLSGYLQQLCCYLVH